MKLLKTNSTISARISLACLFFGAAGLQGQIITAITDNSTLQVLNGGSFNSVTGVYTRAGTDAIQGVVSSFTPVTLTNIGDSVQVSFTWNGGSSGNNQAQRITFGFFDGTAVTGNNQTTATDAWQGYFHAIGARWDNGDVNYGVYRQGDGTQPLFQRTGTWSGTNNAAQVNGAGGVAGTTGTRPGTNRGATTDVSMTATRISATQITFSTVYGSARVGNTTTGSVGGIGYSTAGDGTTATITSTHTIADGGPTTISGIGLVGNADFTVQVVPEPATYALLLGLGTLGLVLLRRRMR